MLALALVMAGVCVAQAFGRFTYGVVLPAVRDDLLGSNRAAGLLGSMNVGAYLAGAVLVAAVSGRVGLGRLVRIGLCFSTAGLLVASFAPNATVLCLGLVTMGLGGAAIWIPSPRLAAAALPPERRGLATGFIGMGIGIGLVFAGRLADVLRDAGGDEAWRAVYRVEGLVGVVVLVATLLWLADDDVPAAPAGAGRAGFGGFGALRRIDGWLALTTAYAAFGFMYLLVFAYLVARLEDDAGFSPNRASTMFAVAGVAVVFGGVVFGPLSDRYGRRAVLVAEFATFGLSAVAILTGDQPWVALGAVGAGLSFAGLPTVIAAYVVDATDVSTYGPVYSAATLAFGGGQLLAPQVGGALADRQGTFTNVFLLAVAMAVLGGVLSARLPGSPRVERPAADPVL